MSRKLASIQRIGAIRSIPGADNIVAAEVLGWSVIVKKDEFQVGDLAVYFEIDSWLPDSEPAFAFLEPRFSNWGIKRGCRLKTIKLKKQLSQGLLLPVSAFAQLSASVLGLDKLSEGDDVTEKLGIEKWEPEEERRANGVAKQAGTSMFPSFIRKTDQERVQNYQNELDKHLSETFEVTIKLDGSSMTVFYVDKSSTHYAHIVEDQEKRMLRKMGWWKKMKWKLRKRFNLLDMPDGFSGVCSRNIQLNVDGDNHFSQFYREHDLGARLQAFLSGDPEHGIKGRSYAFQGELIAPSIQQNHEKVKGFEWYVFDVFDIDAQQYLLPIEARDVVQQLGLNYVPVLYTQTDWTKFYEEGREINPRTLVDAILASAEGPGMNPGVKREGLVFKSNSTPFSFKAISNSYLLKKEGK